MDNLLPDDSEEFFGSVDFKGERFLGANLPVSVLDNIHTYQELLLDLAEEIWREKNPDRKRLPRNFRNNLSLSFSHVEDGSAVAVLKRDESISIGLLPDEFSLNYMALAQSRFLEIARAANENRSVEGFSAKARTPLKALLSDFREGEVIEFVSRTGKDARHPRVRFTHNTKARILESTTDDRQKRIDGLGIVRSILDGPEEIEILSEHGPFRYRVGRNEIRKNKFPIATFCEFTITATLKSNGMIRGVVSEERLDAVQLNFEFDRIRKKLRDFEDFGPGWKNGVGHEMSKSAMDFAEDLSGFVCGLYKDISVFPQIDGSITFEFEKGELDVEVICKEGYVRIEAYDNEANLLNEQVFFGLSPRLLAALSDIEEFAS